MRVIARILMAFLVVIIAVVIVVGPGRIVASAEYPFGVGPWSSPGHYCHNMYGLTRLVDKWHDSGAGSLSAHEATSVQAFEKSLTSTGPHVPRADFTAFFRRTGKKVVKRMTDEGKLLNTWWDSNCSDPLMNVPASLSHDLTGLTSHERFTHYPKNVVKTQFFVSALD